MTLPMKSEIQSDSQNMHDSLYYLRFYLNCDSLIVSDPLMNKVHELILFGRKSHIMMPSPSITLDIGLSKLLTVILSEILSDD